MASKHEQFWTHHRYAFVAHSAIKPFTALSYAAAKKQGKTVFAVTHRINLVSAADKILFLKEGRVAAFGPRDAVLAAMRGAPPKAAEP